METLKILYEDNHIIVVDKPAGILTQGDYSGDESLLEMIKEYIRTKYNKPGEAFT
ncbi:MAG TPA: RNA pseudouridine synthase, partial [Spirochaetota bacterium]|nr:RNA pseudouridine synthase [Spirochaetota bacterium]